MADQAVAAVRQERKRRGPHARPIKGEDMIRADHIIVDNDEGRFTLKVITEAGILTFDVHDVALELYDEIVARIGSYAAEAVHDIALDEVPVPVPTKVENVYDHVEAGYELDDPKSPGYHDRMVD